PGCACPVLLCGSSPATPNPAPGGNRGHGVLIARPCAFSPPGRTARRGKGNEHQAVSGHAAGRASGRVRLHFQPRASAGATALRAGCRRLPDRRGRRGAGQRLAESGTRHHGAGAARRPDFRAAGRRHRRRRPDSRRSGEEDRDRAGLLRPRPQGRGDPDQPAQPRVPVPGTGDRRGATAGVTAVPPGHDRAGRGARRGRNHRVRLLRPHPAVSRQRGIHGPAGPDPGRGRPGDQLRAGTGRCHHRAGAHPVNALVRRPPAGAPEGPPQWATMLPLVAREYRKRAIPMACAFAVIALAALVIGLLLPARYTSSTTILVEETNIIGPLMEGRAVPTGVANRARLTREVAFSRRVMNEILAAGEWEVDRLTPVGREMLLDEIRGRTQITHPRENLIQIAYTDTEPRRAFQVTRRFGELVIDESLAAKERESREAYEFIDEQVRQYHAKLTGA